MYYVLAGNMRQARAWSRERCVARSNWRYVATMEDVAGIGFDEETRVAVVGTFRRRPDARAILDFLRDRNLVL